jgi:hypothetical protein
VNTIVAEVGDDGTRRNSWGCAIVDCRFKCGRLTTMLGTRECDPCHEAYRLASNPTCLNAIKAAFEENAK